MEERKDKPARFVIDIPVDLHRKLKVISVVHDKSMRELVIEAIIDVVERLEVTI